MNKRVNIISIAQISGFSISTVSRVLNGKGPEYRISEDTIKKIFEIAGELNYKPNSIAQSLRLKKSNTIGLIVPDIGNPFFASLASIISIETRKRGYSVILADTEDDCATEVELLNKLVDRNIDAIIMAPCSDMKEHVQKAMNQGTLMLMVDRYFDNCDIPYVTTDNYVGAYEATKYLIDKGHRDIACIQGQPYTMVNKERVSGFKDACRDNKISEYHIAGRSFSIQNGYLETKLLLSSGLHSKPTAFFCLSTTILLGFLKAIKEAGLSIPDDISVIAFDNQSFMDYLNPPITTIAQPIEEIGTVSINVLIDKLEEIKSDLDIKIKLGPQIIYRNSVKDIR